MRGKSGGWRYGTVAHLILYRYGKWRSDGSIFSRFDGWICHTAVPDLPLPSWLILWIFTSECAGNSALMAAFWVGSMVVFAITSSIWPVVAVLTHLVDTHVSYLRTCAVICNLRLFEFAGFFVSIKLMVTHIVYTCGTPFLDATCLILKLLAAPFETRARTHSPRHCAELNNCNV